MLALYIILGILIFLFLLTLLSVAVRFKYDNESYLTVSVGFLRFKVLPPKPEKEKPVKEKKPKKKKKKEEKTDETEEKKPSFIKNLYKQQGVSGILNIVKEAAAIVSGALKDFFRHLRVTKLVVNLNIAGSDAADTAVKYGQACSAFFPAFRIIYEIVNIKHYKVFVNPDFTDGAKMDAYAEVTAKIRIIFLLKLAIVRGIAALKLFIKIRKEGE